MPFVRYYRQMQLLHNVHATWLLTEQSKRLQLICCARLEKSHYSKACLDYCDDQQHKRPQCGSFNTWNFLRTFCNTDHAEKEMTSQSKPISHQTKYVSINETSRCRLYTCITSIRLPYKYWQQNKNMQTSWQTFVTAMYALRNNNMKNTRG